MNTEYRYKSFFVSWSIMYKGILQNTELLTNSLLYIILLICYSLNDTRQCNCIAIYQSINCNYSIAYMNICFLIVVYQLSFACLLSYQLQLSNCLINNLIAIQLWQCIDR